MKDSSHGAQEVLTINLSTANFALTRYDVGDFFGPVDLGLHLTQKQNSLNIGTGLLAGSIFPGSNRLVFTGMSPAWGGFYISTMGGAGLVFNNLGISMVSLTHKASDPSILYLNRHADGQVEVEVIPINHHALWAEGEGGVYSIMETVYDRYADRYAKSPRVLAVGPSAEATDFGSICSVPMKKGQSTHADTWAGRGGFGSQLFHEHGIVAIIYGGDYPRPAYRDRKEANQWFYDRYDTSLQKKDIEATQKYHYNATLDTGGTFGVNYATLKGSMLSFNYQSITMSEAERIKIHEEFILGHYLKQFHDETIVTKSYKTCGEPCTAVCKKMNNQYKKDYEPYQAMGPLSGIFDQRAAEKLNRYGDRNGFDAISLGGTIAWLLDCLHAGLVTPEELGVDALPVFTVEGFDVVASSMHNADLGIALIDAILHQKGLVDLHHGARHFAKRLARIKDNPEILDRFVYIPYAEEGWMVPNQYWAPGVLSPMSIMGKYYMYYGSDFVPPYELGRKGAERFRGELILDNIGICRFHRQWAEEMMPDVVEALYGLKDAYLESIRVMSSRMYDHNEAQAWESKRNRDLIYRFLVRTHEVEGNDDPVLLEWITRFEADETHAALEFWQEMKAGMDAVLLDI